MRTIHLSAGSLEYATRQRHHVEQRGMPEMRMSTDMALAIIRAYVDALSRTAG